MLSRKDPVFTTPTASDARLTAWFAVKILVISISKRVMREDGVRLVSSNVNDFIEERASEIVNVVVGVQSCAMFFNYFAERKRLLLYSCQNKQKKY